MTARKFRKDEKVVIAAAINGMTSRARSPHVPVSPAEIAQDVYRCLDAGAAFIHAHNRDISLTGREAADDYLEAWRPILEHRPDTLWHPTVSGSDAKSFGHVEILAAEAGIRMTTFDPGSANMGYLDEHGIPTGHVYFNSYEDIRNAASVCERYRLTAVVSAHEPNFLRTALAYYKAGRLPGRPMINLYFGAEGGFYPQNARPGPSFGLKPTEHALMAYLELLDGFDLPWCVAVFGADMMRETPIAALALKHGGHLRVGLEDYFHPARQPTNGELVKEAVALAVEFGRPIAGTRDAARIMGIE